MIGHPLRLSRRTFLGSSSAAASSLALGYAKPAQRPNILLILVDDMGFSDVGCYGSEIATPNIDRLASQGVRFSQFYSCARCCPSRASLLTGLYPHQAGIGHMVDQAGPEPGYANDLSPRSRTIAQVLKSAGYQTGMAGKWHVTPFSGSQHNWPLQRGFDRYYGIIHGAADYFNPVTLTYGNDAASPEGSDYYFTDAIGDYAVRFLDGFSRRDDPFFLYTAFTAPHWPLHARPDDIRKYENRYRKGWDALREERHARQLHFGMLPKRWPLSSRDAQVAAWESAQSRDWQARRMEVYAAQVDRMDQNVGRILTKLRETGREKNTLVLFMSDNGGCAEEVGPRWSGLHIPKATRDGRRVQIGNDPSVMPGAEDTYQSYGLPWANCSNTPFRMYKHWVHEGGISSPLVVRWPDRIAARRTWIADPGHFVDVMATCVDASGARYPADDVIPMQGRSLLPLATHGARPVERGIFWEHEGNKAMRRGPWKLVRKYPGEWELYNLDEDRTELRNAAADQPARVRAMSSEWQGWADQAGVLPWEQVSKQQHGR